MFKSNEEHKMIRENNDKEAERSHELTNQLVENAKKVQEKLSKDVQDQIENQKTVNIDFLKNSEIKQNTKIENSINGKIES